MSARKNKDDRIILNPKERIERATDFLIRLRDSCDKRLDSFESSTLSIIIDEYIDLIKEFK